MNISVDRKIEARGRAKTWREAKLENGFCPKHGVILAPLSHCFVCRPDDPLRLLKTGDRLEACFRCINCDRCYHEGSVYHHISARKLRGIKPGPRNSLFNYDERKPGDPCKVLALCGECRKEKRDEWKYREYRTWSGLCYQHAAKARMRVGDVEHPSGATVHRSERLQESGWRKRPIKVMFTCANRENGPHKSAVYLSSTEHSDEKPRLEWRGLCPEHLRLEGVPNKIAEDKPIDGALLCFSRPDAQGRVPIIYGVCKHEIPSLRQTALGYLWAGRISGQCQKCRNNPAAFAERLAELALANNCNKQKNGGTEKNPHGGARNIKWTPARRAELLGFYEEMYSKIKGKDQTLPDDVKSKLKLKGNKPSEVALEYAAECLRVETSEYLRRTVLPEARRERT